MHQAVQDYVFQAFHKWRTDISGWNVLEVGSLDINGSIKSIFEPFANSYTGIDPQAGPGVDEVADGTTYWAPEKFDVVVCCEVFEHTPYWKDIIKQSYINLKYGGLFIATMAGEGRPYHSGVDGLQLREHEHYENIGGWVLMKNLWMFKEKEVNILGTDTRCWAVK